MRHESVRALAQRHEVGREQDEVLHDPGAEGRLDLREQRRIGRHLAQSLGRMVDDQVRPHPLQIEVSGQQIPDERRVPRGGDVALRRLLLHHFGAQRRQPPEFGLGRGGQERRDRITRFTRPVLVEGLRHLADHGTRGKHVQVDELEALVGREILVADVAAADDRRRAVDGQRLVVHPPVQAREVGHVAERRAPRAA